MKKIPMTATGLEKLKKELVHLKTVERPSVVQAIQEARALGDLSENAEYHAAREKQSFIEGRIQELEGKISCAEVIDITRLKGQKDVMFGATVTLIDEDTEKQAVYRIVGEEEADIKSGLISINSPLAKALISKAEGQSIEVPAPGGERYYEIVKVEYL